LSGRRVFFSQIDGDGFYNLTEINRKKTSAEIFWREILSQLSHGTATKIAYQNAERLLKLSPSPTPKSP
jgi:hypothetical protein